MNLWFFFQSQLVFWKYRNNHKSVANISQTKLSQLPKFKTEMIFTTSTIIGIEDLWAPIFWFLKCCRGMNCLLTQKGWKQGEGSEARQREGVETFAAWPTLFGPYPPLLLPYPGQAMFISGLPWVSPFKDITFQWLCFFWSFNADLATLFGPYPLHHIQAKQCSLFYGDSNIAF